MATTAPILEHDAELRMIAVARSEAGVVREGDGRVGAGPIQQCTFRDPAEARAYVEQYDHDHQVEGFRQVVPTSASPLVGRSRVAGGSLSWGLLGPAANTSRRSQPLIAESEVIAAAGK